MLKILSLIIFFYFINIASCFANEGIYNIKNKLETKIKNFISTEIEWKSLNTKIISKDKLETTMDFLETLEEEDDVQSVYTNHKFENN